MIKKRSFPKLFFSYYSKYLMYEKKNPHDSPSVESMEEGVRYAFTLNPDDTYQQFDQPLRLSRFYDMMKAMLLSYSDSFIVNATVEVSKNGRLHLHGFITFKNLLRFYIDDVHRLQKVSTYCIKVLDDEAEWEEYCSKAGNLIPEAYRYISTPTNVVKISNNIKITPKIKHKSF